MAEPRRTSGTDAGDLAGARLLVVEARFYDDIADALLAGAARAIQAAGGSYERVSVPGSLEVPPAIAIALEIVWQSASSRSPKAPALLDRRKRTPIGLLS